MSAYEEIVKPNYPYMTLYETIMANGMRHDANGDRYFAEGKLEHAKGSYRKAKRNFERARSLMFVVSRAGNDPS